jgi:hypothetical protein
VLTTSHVSQAGLLGGSSLFVLVDKFLLLLEPVGKLAKQNNEQDNYQNKAQTSTQIVFPASAIWPRWQSGDQEQNQNVELESATRICRKLS